MALRDALIPVVLVVSWMTYRLLGFVVVQPKIDVHGGGTFPTG